MKNFSIIRKSLPVLLCLSGLASGAQEINFSRAQDMTTWYNPSLKTEQKKSVKLNYRNINYDGLIAYNSTSAMFDMGIGGGEEGSGGFLGLSIGAASDKSNQDVLNNTLGLLGISYAVPLGGNGIYIAAGAQGSYFQSRLKTGSMIAFGDQYDQYGPIEGSVSNDALAAGWSYNYFSVNAGVSVFGNSASGNWYIGTSVMNANRPFSNEIKTEDFRQNRRLGVQAGYKFITPEKDECAFYSSLNWQGKAFKHFFNGVYFKQLKGIDGGIGVGMGYRYDDALVPSVELRYDRAIIALGYDVNVSSINAAAVRRNGMELALRFDF